MHFPDAVLTEELIIEALQRDSSIVMEIPSKFITKNIAQVVLQSWGGYIRYIPEAFLDEELCLIAIENDPEGVDILSVIPEKLRTYRVCMAAVKTSGYNFEFVPAQHRTYELCLQATQTTGFIDDLPEEYYTEELCLALLKHDGLAIDSIPREKLTEKMCLTALNHFDRGLFGGTMLKHIPREMLTQAICDKAVEKTLYALVMVPDEFVTEEMLVRVATRDPRFLSENFPMRYRNDVFLHKLIEVNPNVERFIPKIMESRLPNWETLKKIISR